jgi:predicted ATPase
MPSSRASPSGSFSSPFLKRLALLPGKADRRRFPFDRLRFLGDDDFALDFTTPITFFVGENGSGKSTVLEAIAALCGFPAAGGSRDHRYDGTESGVSALAEALRPSWLPKVARGFYFRSESFCNLAVFIDATADIGFHGGRRMREQSHGEAFMALFANRLGTDERVLYLMDEPENALSPTRQLSFLALLREWEKSGRVQAVIATHSPIVMSYPGARLLSFDGDALEETAFEETEHYRVTRAFLGNPQRYLAEIFGD